MTAVARPVALPVVLVDVVGLGDVCFGVGDQREAEAAVLVGEGALVVQDVDRASGEADAELLEPVEPGLELDGLGRAARRVGLGIEEQDERAGLEGVAELEASAGGIGVEARGGACPPGSRPGRATGRTRRRRSCSARWGSRSRSRTCSALRPSR